MYFGQTSDTIGFVAFNGVKYVNSIPMSYGSSVTVGDNLTIKVDLRPLAMNVEFFKNSVSMGLAYGGLEDWKDIHIGLSFGQNGMSVKIIDYQVSY